MRLAGKDVADFFQPSVDCVVEAVLEQIKAKRGDIRVSLSKIDVVKVHANERNSI